MKLKFTLFISLFFLLLSSGSTFAQAVGDFRSNGTGGGDWTLTATWQTWNGAAWVAAGSTPSTGQVITVQTADSVFLNSTITFEQIVVQTGAILTLYAPSTTATYTLNNVPAGSAISNTGKVYLAGAAATLTGAGTLRNNVGGLLILEFSPTLAVNTINNGEADITSTVNIQTATLTNNGFLNWIANNINMSAGALIVNNDSLLIRASSSLTGTGTFNNAAGSVIYSPNASTIQFVAGINFTNAGTVKGFGSYSFPGATSNTGTIAPGNNSSAILTLDPVFAATGASPTYNLGLYSGGHVAGTNYSQVAFSTGPAIPAGSTLTVTDAATGDAVSTVYTLFTASAGTITGTFTTVNLPPSLGTLTYNPTSITVSRLVVLPLTWGSFTAVASGSQAHLSWTTLQENNTSHFTIQRSANGVSFTSIGTVAAKGNSTGVSSYSFTDANPGLNGFDYYRLAETDLDGKTNYSLIRVLSFGKGSSVIVQTSPNPVKDLLNIVVQEDDITIVLNDMSGRTLQTLHLAQGFHQTSMSGLPKGVYQLAIYQKNEKIDSRQILKF